MNHKERIVIAYILAFIALFIGTDVITDLKEGVSFSHVLAEAVIGFFALFGVFYLLRGSAVLKRRLEQEMHDFSRFKLEAEAWRNESRKYIEGLAKAIDQQLSKWNLSAAEKEVAFLLLKGLSLKEVAEVRQTTEKTVRVQAMSIYSKSGLAGRAELSAFFLEDLFLPTAENQPKECL